MKLSVIVPVYNLERYVAATLDSLLDIAFPYEYEIIVINDGSTDNSRSIIEAYQSRTEKIILLNIENGGVSNARNVGAQKARGEYITFVDGDDTVEKTFFETAVRELEELGCDFVQANLRLLSGPKAEYDQFVQEDILLTDKKEMLMRFFGPTKIISNSACGKVFRADLLRNKSFDPSLRIAEDQKYVFDAICASRSIKLLQTIGYNYYQHAGSAMHALDRKRAGDILKVLEYCRDNVDSQEIRTAIDADRLDILFFVYHDSVINGDNQEAVVQEIAAMDEPSLRAVMSRKARTKLFALMHARRLYDLALKGNHRLKNNR